MNDALVLGAVAYDAKVVTIWDGFQRWFRAEGLDFDYVLYSNYERQVEQHLRGAFDVAWNSPLAWLQAEAAARAAGRTARAIAMRDTDQDLRSLLVVRSASAIQTLEDLRGKTIGVGAGDSPQATLIPLQHLAELGLLAERDFRVRRFDVLVGKHGDHVGGERDAARALMAGEVDAACMIDGNHLVFTNEGTLPRGATRVLDATALYDHCNFTVLDGAPERAIARFQELLLGMRYEDPAVRPLLDLEGLKAWRPGRTSGYALLERACERTGELASFVQRVARVPHS
ncbi:MAG: PhnD/SsuA/transferrin family substrate-binding protein [Planctomycetes bacterium]|nr:PhnD/SsuA/transferrin family substrate-binding protein [Planctomycetota bacterium]